MIVTQSQIHKKQSVKQLLEELKKEFVEEEKAKEKRLCKKTDLRLLFDSKKNRVRR